MIITEITTGVLNNFNLFYGNVEFYNDGSEEVYEALKDYASKEMLKSAEMWTATFEYKKKEYGIMGDGEMTSSGHYLLAEVENENKAINPNNLTQGGNVNLSKFVMGYLEHKEELPQFPTTQKFQMFKNETEYAVGEDGDIYQIINKNDKEQFDKEWEKEEAHITYKAIYSTDDDNLFFNYAEDGNEYEKLNSEIFDELIDKDGKIIYQNNVIIKKLEFYNRILYRVFSKNSKEKDYIDDWDKIDFKKYSEGGAINLKI